MKQLTTEAFNIIRDRLIPVARIGEDTLVIADYETVVRMASWLEFDIKIEETNLRKVLKENKLPNRGLSTIDEHRFICKSLDDGLKTDKHLKRFEADLEFLQSKFQ